MDEQLLDTILGCLGLLGIALFVSFIVMGGLR